MQGNSEKRQKDHFNDIATLYEAHYGDTYSVRYREEFIVKPLFRGIDINKKKILDAMCGGGEITQSLVNYNCDISGLDLSESQIEICKRKYPECHYTVGSIVDLPYLDGSFDIVVVQGGLHHVHPDVKKTVKEILRVLKPGGYFLNGEIHSGSIVDKFRKFWYRQDKYFEDNEESIDYELLENDFAHSMRLCSISYFGNIAYYLVINSMIVRLPFSIKQILSPPLLFIEKLLTPYHTKYFSSYAITQWEKLPEKNS